MTNEEYEKVCVNAALSEARFQASLTAEEVQHLAKLHEANAVAAGWRPGVEGIIGHARNCGKTAQGAQFRDAKKVYKNEYPCEFNPEAARQAVKELARDAIERCARATTKKQPEVSVLKFGRILGRPNGDIDISGFTFGINRLPGVALTRRQVVDAVVAKMYAELRKDRRSPELPISMGANGNMWIIPDKKQRKRPPCAHSTDSAGRVCRKCGQELYKPQCDHVYEYHINDDAPKCVRCGEALTP